MGDNDRTRSRRVRHAAGCVVYRGDGENRRFLLIRDPYKRWTLPKGHLEGNEDNREAAVREVLEETGISGELGAHIGTIVYFFNDGHPIEKRVAFFLMRADGNIEAKPQTSEGISAVGWFAAEQARSMIDYDQVRDIFSKALVALKNQ